LERQQPENVKVLVDRAILGIVALCAVIFVVFGLIVQRPLLVMRGVGAILTTRDALLADYFEARRRRRWLRQRRPSHVCPRCC
jgi:hypothetical protein